MESGGTTFHRIPEGLLTSEGLESLIATVEAQIASHEAGMQYLLDSVAGWERIVADQERHVAEAEAEAKAKCDAAAAAKQAYEDCIKAAAAPAPAPAGGGAGGTGTTGGGSTPPPGESGSGGGTAPGGAAPGGSGPGVTTGGEPDPEPDPPACEEGQTQQEEKERKSFVVPATTGSLVISIDPPTEEFADWMAGEMSDGGGWFSPSHLNDGNLAGTIRDKLRGLDSGMAVSHSVRIEIPRREITYACVQHWVCRGGEWVESHKELREVGRKDLAPIVIEESGKTNSGRVSQLIVQAQRQYQRLVQADDSISQFCQ